MGMSMYITKVYGIIQRLTEQTRALDNKCIEFIETVEPPVILTQKNLHMIHHLKKDIARFGLPLNYETEHGEQFNKFIRKNSNNNGKQ
jgi:hypothetical protein